MRTASALAVILLFGAIAGGRPSKPTTRSSQALEEGEEPPHAVYDRIRGETEFSCSVSLMGGGRPRLLHLGFRFPGKTQNDPAKSFGIVLVETLTDPVESVGSRVAVAFLADASKRSTIHLTVRSIEIAPSGTAYIEMSSGFVPVDELKILADASIVEGELSSGQQFVLPARQSKYLAEVASRAISRGEKAK